MDAWHMAGGPENQASPMFTPVCANPEPLRPQLCNGRLGVTVTDMLFSSLADTASLSSAGMFIDHHIEGVLSALVTRALVWGSPGPVIVP